MIRILLFVAVVLAAGFGLSWLADRPGELILTWQGQRLETSLLVGIAAVVAAIIAVMVLWWLIRAIVTSPDMVQRYFRTRRRDRGYRALSTGLIAAGAGDAALARKMTRRTRGLLSVEQEPLIHVLEAQTYMIEGRHDDARAKFEAMSEDPETRELGLRGLYLEARRLDSQEAAQHYAERAAEQSPHLPWAAKATLEYRTKEKNWDEAIRLLERQRAARTLTKEEAERKRAVLLTGRAMEALESDPRKAASDAQEALRLAPTLVPAAIAAARALFRLNDLKRGSKILERVWKSNPHPEIADTYVRARAGDSVQDRLRRARKLEALKPNNAESLRIVAQSALDAHDHALARQSAEAALRQQPREGLYLLLADIEEADTGDEGRVRHWMAQALRAPRDPAWTADGYVAPEWAPVSPVTGEIDAFVWKVPVEQAWNRQIEGSNAPASDPDEAIRSLPPVRPGPEARASRPVDAEPQPPAPEKPAVSKAAEKPAEPGKPAEASPRADKGSPATADQGPEAPVAAPSPGAADTESSPKPLASEGGREGGAVIIPLQASREEGARHQQAKPPKDHKAAKPEEAPDTKPPLLLEAAPRRDRHDPGAGETNQPPRHGEQKAKDAARDDEEKEPRFLGHPVDDPGVEEDVAPREKSTSRFRLF